MGNTVTAILQARMGSTRLPGKVVKPALGRPLVEYEIKRLQQCKGIKDLVLATSDMNEDDPIAEVGRALGISVFRGSQSDVLDRYYQAASSVSATHIMRVTGDCPLIDPAICDSTVEKFFSTGADYIATSPRYAEGLDCEVFTFAALEAAWKEAELDSEREHVTLFIRNRPERFVCELLDNPRDDSHYRITVDEPQDFEVVQAVLNALIPEHGLSFSFDHVRSFLDTHPNICNLNSQIIRNEGLIKSLEDEVDL